MCQSWGVTLCESRFCSRLHKKKLFSVLTLSSIPPPRLSEMSLHSNASTSTLATISSTTLLRQNNPLFDSSNPSSPLYSPNYQVVSLFSPSLFECSTKWHVFAARTQSGRFHQNLGTKFEGKEDSHQIVKSFQSFSFSLEFNREPIGIRLFKPFIAIIFPLLSSGVCRLNLSPYTSSQNWLISIFSQSTAWKIPSRSCGTRIMWRTFPWHLCWRLKLEVEEEYGGIWGSFGIRDLR